MRGMHVRLGTGHVEGVACTGHEVTIVSCEGSQRRCGRALFALASRGLEGGICGCMTELLYCTKILSLFM